MDRSTIIYHALMRKLDWKIKQGLALKLAKSIFQGIKKNKKEKNLVDKTDKIELK